MKLPLQLNSLGRRRSQDDSSVAAVAFLLGSHCHFTCNKHFFFRWFPSVGIPPAFSLVKTGRQEKH